MDPVAKYTNYYCWHLVTIVLLAVAAGFSYAAVLPGGADIAVLTIALSAAFAAWSLLLVAWKYRHPWRLPQWVLFLAIAAVGVTGLV